jgi:hypothetical protein
MADPSQPECTHGLLPALPPGTYQTSVVQSGPITIANVIRVTLTSPAAQSAFGALKGTLEAVGGPLQTQDRPLPGTIIVSNGAGIAVTATAGPDGVFSAQIPVGSYTVTGAAHGLWSTAPKAFVSRSRRVP